MATAKQVEGEVFKLMRNSNLSTAINGNVYREGMRPRDSRKEDAVVNWTAGIEGDIAEGVVTCHVYVPDIEIGGVMVADSARIETLEGVAQTWAKGLNARSDYKFALNSSIGATQDEELHQHIIVIVLNYQVFNQ